MIEPMRLAELERLTSEEDRGQLQARLNDGTPKCANCKHWKEAFLAKETREGQGFFTRIFDAPNEDRKKIGGKGICGEPSALQMPNQRQPIVVTDLALCSLWERKQ